jgi:hypothetical protein
MQYVFIRLALTIWLSAFVSSHIAAAERVDFNRDIRPILADKCFQCHGPDGEAREAGLRLDLLDDDQEGPFREHDGAAAIAPGQLEASSLWERITTEDESARMPPPESGKHPVTDEERERIRQWILQGAEYEEFWAFVPPQPQAAPAVQQPDWCLSHIDQFVLARLEREGRQPSPPADRRSLIRRLTFDLTGLPPTREEIRQFLDDEFEDAYEQLVDRLIASPAYGEHMAKYWLDLVRFADTNGLHHDHYREVTPYRDWVIRAFNENLSFDRFLTDQLAGDLHDEPTTDQLIASGFNRLHLVIDVGTALPEESFHRNVIDRVTAVGTAFMGMTVGCAVCHDHKYDPLTQRDFYQLYAFFNNIDAEPETPGGKPHPPFLSFPTTAQSQRQQSLEAEVAEAAAAIEQLQAELEQLQAELEQSKAAGEEEEGDEPTEQESSLAARLQEQEEQLKQLQADQKALDKAIPVALIMKEREDVRPTRVLIRGVYDQPGAAVQRDTPAFLPPLGAAGDVTSRLDLARWFVDPGHPLTSRVTVNRFWQQFFGAGLVLTSEDFGAQGEVPSHPALLDDLAAQFVESSWDVKGLVKSLVMSQTYRQSAAADAAAFRADPRNRLLARGSRFRLDAEMIRDQILATSGLLNRAMYGQSVKPPQPPNLWKTVSMVSSNTYSFQADTGDKIYRRSLYSFWKRALPPPQMTIFDAPTRESCIARRERTNTPLQALVLMNEAEYFKAARHFSGRLLEEPDATDEQRLIQAYETITSQLPDGSELAILREALDAFRAMYRVDAASAQAMTADVKTASDEQRVELAAYTMMVNALFNLDAVKTRE